MNPETRNFIDGRLVDASNGATFQNVNPATEAVLGVTADATRDDMDRAIAAARRAFDTTDWSTNHAFRQRCLTQLHQALTNAKDELREIVIAEDWPSLCEDLHRCTHEVESHIEANFRIRDGEGGEVRVV